MHAPVLLLFAMIVVARVVVVVLIQGKEVHIKHMDAVRAIKTKRRKSRSKLNQQVNMLNRRAAATARR